MSYKPQYKDMDGNMQELPIDAESLSGKRVYDLENQNAFNMICVENDNNGLFAQADSPTDKLTFVAGNGITFENDSTDTEKRFKISATADLTSGYATCSTSASTVAKTVAFSGFKLVVGAMMTVKFTYAHTSASAATLNVNSTGAKTIVWRNGTTVVYSSTASSSRAWIAGDILTFIYDGTYWRILTVDPYPVGSIYMSTDSTSPASRFGGTWTQISGRFLLGTGANAANTSTTYGSLSAAAISRSVNEMGGEVRHTLTVSEMPSHNHSGKGTGDKSSSSESVAYTSNWSKYQVFTDFTDDAGGDAAHNNMPPYYTVYMWRRTA